MNEKPLNSIELFHRERAERIESYKSDERLRTASHEYMKELIRTNFIFNFSWLGRPVIQFPQDMFIMQELIWATKPDIIIETGIAHGGSIIFYASMLELLGKGKVIGIDIDIRSHNRTEIENHPLYRRVEMIEGSSTAAEVVEKVRTLAAGAKSIMVVLDSNHTHDHVLKELESYAPLVSVGNYCVVFDTAVEDFARECPIVDRPWGSGNNPKTAVWKFMKGNDSFIIDSDVEAKLLITSAPDGFLRRVR
jgi:cephalosporin hydroxylase